MNSGMSGYSRLLNGLWKNNSNKNQLSYRKKAKCKTTYKDKEEFPQQYPCSENS